MIRRMLMKKMSLVILVLALLTTMSFADDIPTTLQTLIDLAKENSLQQQIDYISIQKLQLEKEDVDKEAKRNKATGSNKDEKYRLYKLRIIDTTIAENALNNKKRLQAMHKAELEKDVENALAEAVLSYDEYKLAQEKLLLKELELKAIKLKQSLGVALQIDVIEAESATEQERLNRVNLLNKMEEKELALKKIIGAENIHALAVPYEIAIKEKLELTIEDEIDGYINHQQSVIQATDTLELTEKTYQFVEDLFSVSSKEYKQAKLDYLEASRKLRIEKANARAKIKADYNRLNVYYKQYEIAQKMLALKEKRLNANKIKSKQGSISKLDLQASEYAYKESQYALKVAVNRYNNALNEFNYLIKNYSEKEINIVMKK